MIEQSTTEAFRELSLDELAAVSGAGPAQPCVYEAGNRCYVWGRATVQDWIEWFVAQGQQ